MNLGTGMRLETRELHLRTFGACKFQIYLDVSLLEADIYNEDRRKNISKYNSSPDTH